MFPRLWGSKLFGDTPYGGTFAGSVADRLIVQSHTPIPAPPSHNLPP